MTSLGFVGFPGTGKDAIARVLVEKHGYERMAFGDAVKEMLVSIDPVYSTVEQLELYKRASTHYTREKLQNLGETMRQMDPDFWVRVVEEKGIPDKVVYTDIRYLNELSFVQRNTGGKIINIKRDGKLAVNNHVSEWNTHVIAGATDCTVHNNGTIEEAVEKVLEYAASGV